jgi:hypothetical protein
MKPIHKLVDINHSLKSLKISAAARTKGATRTAAVTSAGAAGQDTPPPPIYPPCPECVESVGSRFR